MSTDYRLRLMRRLAWAVVGLMLVVTSASAWLRLAQPRPACVDWPSCRSADRPARHATAPPVAGHPGAIGVVRHIHRIAASTVLLLVLALTVLTLRQPRRRTAGALALALLLLAMGLSALGIVTSGSRAAGVLLGNLLGGLLMLGLAWALLRGLADLAVPGRALAAAALAGAVLWTTQAALGGLAGAGMVDAAPTAHMALALVAAPWAFCVGSWARGRGRKREGSALIAVAAGQMVLGPAAAAWAAPTAGVLAHNVFAALGLALMLGLALGASCCATARSQR